MTLVCDETGCPLASDGRCVEGHADPAECPHTQEVAEPDEPSVDTPDTETLPDADARESPAQSSIAVDELIDLGGDESLSLTEAEPIAARYGARVVLVAGAFEVGKTSLVAGLYGLFLEGPSREWGFAGSLSLKALDARYHGKRAATGNREPTMQRTEDEDMRLIDLRISDGDRRINLMFSDVRGEYFEDVVSGRPVSEVISIAARADCVLILIDGAQLADPYQRASAVGFAHQLIGGLTELGGVKAGVPIALVVSKLDQLGDCDPEWLSAQLHALRNFAVERGAATVDVFQTAAFPSAEHPEHLGMRDLLDWLLEERRALHEHTPDDSPVARSYLKASHD